MIKDKRIAFAIYVVAFIVVWNIVDLLVRTITGNHAGDVDIVVPLIVAMVTGYLFYMAKTVDINDELEAARAAKEPPKRCGQWDTPASSIWAASTNTKGNWNDKTKGE